MAGKPYPIFFPYLLHTQIPHLLHTLLPVQKRNSCLSQHRLPRRLWNQGLVPCHTLLQYLHLETKWGRGIPAFVRCLQMISHIPEKYAFWTYRTCFPWLLRTLSWTWNTGVHIQFCISGKTEVIIVTCNVLISIHLSTSLVDGGCPSGAERDATPDINLEINSLRFERLKIIATIYTRETIRIISPIHLVCSWWLKRKIHTGDVCNDSGENRLSLLLFLVYSFIFFPIGTHSIEVSVYSIL